MNNLQSFNEFLDLSPIKLKMATTINNVPLYTSDKIIEVVSNWVTSSSFTKPISNKIIEGLQNGVIIVGYHDKRFLSVIKKRMDYYFTSSGTVITGGYVDSEFRKIVITLDDNVNIFGKSLKDICPILNHELTHYACFSNWNKYIYTCVDPIINFFKKLFYNLPNKDLKLISDSDIRSTIVSISKYSEKISSKSKSNLAEYAFNEWYKLFKTSTQSPSSNWYASLLFFPYYQYVENRLNPKYYKDSKHMLESYYTVYNKLGYSVWDYTIPAQEVIFPSEILCIMNQFKLSSEMIKLINSTSLTA